MKIFLWQVDPSSDTLKQPGIIRVQQIRIFFRQKLKFFYQMKDRGKP
jgi:hypothetical protein